ncbi:MULTISPECIES: sulfate ABC transporter permease subunit CysT [Vitreoscilla]|uniref:Sulfate transport system permease protein CysT n=1 Tax=Vitreoscilla stercoraria TaxID=61 RepID=A0ABY4E7I3_VITST|nr:MULTISPECIES: sulfate ABC transporter permease subunit CysT [Vitreoscilla]AUZ04561.2 sulfate ABC transporter permease CysT [Vitreoscilla sp. C1]UOO91734.1 sulfate ABC transporter permease subunit CysT [Vitreoscilla stercoraria]
MLFLKSPTVLPGFKFSLAVSAFWLSILVLLPFSMLALSITDMGLAEFWRTITEEQVLAALWLSLKVSFYAAAINLVFGTLIAWVIVRYDFFGKSIINAIVDLPFALPTAVTGITLATLYAPNGWIGQLLAPMGIKVAFTPLGILIALIVVSLPFVVRTVQPVLEELQPELEEAATTMGASRFTIIRRVVLPELVPALITSFGMMFARATGEYGSVVFIAGNIPMVSQILPLVITSKLDLFDVQGASAVALFMLLISFVILSVLNIAQWSVSRKIGAKV